MARLLSKFAPKEDHSKAQNRGFAPCPSSTLDEGEKQSSSIAQADSHAPMAGIKLLHPLPDTGTRPAVAWHPVVSCTARARPRRSPLS